MVGNSERALSDDTLQAQLRVAMPGSRASRSAAATEVPEWEELRSAAARMKDRALAHLDDYLVQFESRFTAAGGVVHWAQDASEARSIVAAIARERGARLAVKGKSMTTEEIDLNPALEAAGIRVVETDLGEYVAQLAGERPSHLIAPIVHKPASAVADLFTQKLGVPRYERPEDLARAARTVLRSEFLSADIGITGANFAIAETGTLVIVENEGNIRLATSIPRTHVAVMGIEKVIPTLADASVFLRLLARSGTGQRASVYVSMITGPRRGDEHDGPRELHLVVVDNGRTRLLADPALREALRCIRCGACQNACPVYGLSGGHAYDAVYAGPIGSVLTPAMEGLPRAAELPFASTLCGACADACPVKIDLPGMLLELRAGAAREGLTKPLDRLFARAWAAVMGSPARLTAAGRVGRLLQRLVVRQGRIERLPYPASGWTAHRSAPPLAPVSFREWWQRRVRAGSDRSAGGVR